MAERRRSTISRGAGDLRLGARDGDEAARVAGSERAGTDEALRLAGQGEETDGVGEVGAPIAGQGAEQPIGVRRGLAQALELGLEGLSLGDGVNGRSAGVPG